MDPPWASWPVVEDLTEYELDRSFISLVGGGGSGAVINALAESIAVRCQMAKNAPHGSPSAWPRPWSGSAGAHHRQPHLTRTSSLSVDVISSFGLSARRCEDTVDVH